MTVQTEAIHENGMLRLLGPTPLQPHQKVRVVIEIDEAEISVEDRSAWASRLRSLTQFEMGNKPTRDEMNER